MSYILDALKKSEQERQNGVVPSINSQPPDKPPRSRPGKSGWLSLVLVVLLLNVGVLLWWLKPWQPEKGGEQPIASRVGSVIDSGMAKKVEPAAPALPATVVSTEAPVVQPVEPVGRDQEETAEETDPGLEMGDRSETTAAQGALLPKAEISQTPRPASVDGMTASSDIGQGPQAGKEEIDSSPFLPDIVKGEGGADRSATDAAASAIGPAPNDRSDNPTEEEAAGREQAVSTTAQSSPPANTPTTGKISGNQTETIRVKALQDYRQLPLAVQQQLPDLQISLHLYAEKPERRKVSIDGRVMREKERINDDLILEEITPDGVILNFNGRRFHKGVFR